MSTLPGSTVPGTTWYLLVRYVFPSKEQATVPGTVLVPLTIGVVPGTRYWYHHTSF